MESELLQFLLKQTAHAYRKGQVILRPEQEEDCIFFIMHGFVRAHTITEEGNEFSAVLLGEGLYFPIFRYLSGCSNTKKLAIKYYYSAVTETKIVTVNSANLIQFLTTNPKIAAKLSEIYYFNIKLLQSKLEFMTYTHAAYRKVCYFLVFLCKKFGQEQEGCIKILPPFTHKEFATFVGLSRESVSHQLSLLKKMQIIDESRQIICIKNLQLLENEVRKYDY